MVTGGETRGEKHLVHGPDRRGGPARIEGVRSDVENLREPIGRQQQQDADETLHAPTEALQQSDMDLHWTDEQGR